MSIGGGEWPVWAADGSEFFYYREVDNTMMAVEVNTDRKVGSATELFQGNYYGHAQPTFHVAPDGRFLMMKDAVQTTDSENPTRVVVVQNWVEELMRLVPVK